jgi:hypothetical protein
VYIATEKRIFGDWYEERLELINKMHELSAQIAKMRLMGRANWSKADYDLAYEIKSGLVEIPTGPLYKPESYLMGRTHAENIKRGLFNVRRWIGETPLFDKKNDPFPDLPDVQPSNLFPRGVAGAYSNPVYTGTVLPNRMRSRYANDFAEAA